MNLPHSYLLNSFMARVLGAMMLVLIVTTMALNAYFSHQNAERFKANLIQHSQSLGRTLARSSRVAVFTGNKDQLARVAASLITEKECQLIAFFDENGMLLQRYKGKGYWGNLESLIDDIFTHHIRDQHMGTSLAKEVGSSILVVEPVMTEAKYTTEEIFADNLSDGQLARSASLIGYVVMITDSSLIHKETRSVFVRDTAIIISITLLSCLLTLIVIHYFVALPLRRLVFEIRRLSDNGGGHAASSGGPDIPRDFSEIITILQTSYNTIYELKNTLEEKVEYRTKQLDASNQELTAQKRALISANEQLSDTLIQLQAAQTHLVQSEKMAALGMLISGLSHEIKNSINFIAGSLPLLEMTLAAALKGGGECHSARINVLLANIREGVDRTVRVITDLATFCHDGGTVFSSIDILPGLKSAVAIVRREFGKRIAISEDHAEVLPMIRGLGGQLNQVFLNLLLNAAQSIDDQGVISVKSWKEANMVHISINDTGHGIDPHILRRIFDPFFTTKDVGEGTGLGLSISYSTIKSHGGDIVVTSEEGSGSTFEIVLPVAADR